MTISKKNTFITAATLCVAVAASTLAFADGHSGKKAQKAAAEYRQSTFIMVGHHFGIMGDMVKGKVEFDAAAFAENADAVAALGKLAPTGFVVEGAAGKSRAKKEIWKDKAAFDEKMTAFQTASVTLAEATKGGDEGKMKAAFGDVAKSCKGCHTDYRAKK